MSETYRVGQLVVVRDPDVGDEYLARVAQEIKPGTHARNPIVEILRILAYPNQRAVFWPDVANENPPLGAGTLCPMPVSRAPARDDLRFDSWEASLAAALSAAMGGARSEEEIKILRRHAAGIIRGRRAILTYKRWQLWHP